VMSLLNLEDKNTIKCTKRLTNSKIKLNLKKLWRMLLPTTCLLKVKKMSLMVRKLWLGINLNSSRSYLHSTLQIKLLSIELNRSELKKKSSNQLEVIGLKVQWVAKKMAVPEMKNLLLEYLVLTLLLRQSNGKKRSRISEIFTSSSTQESGKLSSTS